MRRLKSQRSPSSRGMRRLGTALLAMALAPALSACFILGMEKPDSGLDVPARYRAGPPEADAALPSIMWWRGFGSKELTLLIEEALTSNLDIQAAVARIVQADANARVAGAALLPVVDLHG